MRVSRRQAGKPIRAMASNRRMAAIVHFVFAGIFTVALYAFVHALRSMGSSFLSIVGTDSTTLPWPTYLLYLLPLLPGMVLVEKGMRLLRRARDADQGAQGEEDVARSLHDLLGLGWKLEYNVPLGGRLGDADIVCTSPRQRSYVIDVKSHRGDVFSDGQQLFRRHMKQVKPFPKDFIGTAMKQALQLKQQQQLRYVTPIVAFSDARISQQPIYIRKVHVVEKSALGALLQQLG